MISADSSSTRIILSADPTNLDRDTCSRSNLDRNNLSRFNQDKDTFSRSNLDRDTFSRSHLETGMMEINLFEPTWNLMFEGCELRFACSICPGLISVPRTESNSAVSGTLL